MTTIRYSNGKVLAEYTKNTDNKYVGYFICFWVNGQMLVECTYAEDGTEKRIGQYKYYTFEGDLFKKGYFDEAGKEHIFFSLNPLDIIEPMC